MLAIFFVTLYALYRMERRGSTGGQRTYQSEALVQRGIVRTVDDLEADMLHLWRLRCAGKQASRREMVRRGEMTSHRWNDASQRLERLRLVAGRDRYTDGAERIRAYVAERKRLAATPSYVEP